MSVLENLAGRTAQWVIVDTSYFDSATHSFMRGDIEIDGSKIERILPPKTSRRTEVLPGHEIVCIPGFINADTGLAQEDWLEHSQELARCGITTAGSFNRGLPDCDGFEGGGVRRLVYVELGESPPGDGLAGVDRQALERFERAANSRAFDRCTFLPAVGPREIWSAASLIALTSFAERVGRRLCVRLSGTNADAQNYRETRFFSEIGLLSSKHSDCQCHDFRAFPTFSSRRHHVARVFLEPCMLTQGHERTVDWAGLYKTVVQQSRDRLFSWARSSRGSESACTNAHVLDNTNGRRRETYANLQRTRRRAHALGRIGTGTQRHRSNSGEYESRSLPLRSAVRFLQWPRQSSLRQTDG
jgi:hypothetical protein